MNQSNTLKRVALGLVLAAPSLSATPALAQAHALSNGRLTVGFATDPRLPAYNQDRVDSILWVSPSGVSTGNMAVNSVGTGQYTCSDPAEFFGQSIGGPYDGDKPLLVTGGDITTWHGTGQQGATKKTGNVCGKSSAPVLSVYKVFDSTVALNELSVTRYFQFAPGTPLFDSDLHAYIPRIAAATYATDLIPNRSGLVQTYAAGACGGGCTITDWNGSWIAEDNGSGSGLAIIRSKTSLAPAAALIDEDSYSGSNASSVLLLQPASGWNKPVVETEYLCFYDPTTWTEKARAAGRLPEGCELR